MCRSLKCLQTLCDWCLRVTIIGSWLDVSPGRLLHDFVVVSLLCVLGTPWPSWRHRSSRPPGSSRSPGTQRTLYSRRTSKHKDFLYFSEDGGLTLSLSGIFFYCILPNSNVFWELNKVSHWDNFRYVNSVCNNV